MAVTIRKSPAITPIRENRTDSIRFFASKDCLTKMSPPPRKVRPSTKHMIRLPISIFRHRPQRLHFLLNTIIACLLGLFRQTHEKEKGYSTKNYCYCKECSINKEPIFLLLLMAYSSLYRYLRTDFCTGRSRRHRPLKVGAAGGRRNIRRTGASKRCRTARSRTDGR